MAIRQPVGQYISQAESLNQKASMLLQNLESMSDPDRTVLIKDLLATLSLCQASISAAKSILLSEIDRANDELT